MEEIKEEIDVEREYLEKNKIKKIFVDGEKIYIKKSKWFDWSVVHPAKTDGKTNWKNLISGGSWVKLGIIFFIILIILGCVYEYSTALKITNDCLNSTRILNITGINLPIN